MPVSRYTSAGLSDQVAAAYGRAELRLLRQMAKHLGTGHGAPDWMDAKLAELQLFRRRAEAIVAQATAEGVAASGEAVTRGYMRGVAAGQGDLDAAGMRFDTPPRQAEHAVEALVRAQQQVLEDVGLTVLRSTVDAYRDAVANAVAGTLSGAQTRRQDAQDALDALARQGITGFTDKAGKRWGLESYVDMATRTATAKASVAGHLDRLEAAGINLVMVSTSSRECALCRPWEGKVLSRGPFAAMQTNVLTGETELVVVDGSVPEATAAGLFHPNCTHNLSAYIHGATKAGDSTPNPEGYAAQQRQRDMERRVREWKRREAVALTPEAKRLARGKIRQWQAAIADHTATHALPRKRWRESMDVKPHVVRSVPDVPVERLDDELLQQAMSDLMAAGDYGPRFAALADELDRRDAERNPPAPTVSPQPDAVSDQAAVDALLENPNASTIAPLTNRPKRDREAELRDEYDSWVHTQWLRAEEDTRGSLLSKAGDRAYDAGLFDILDLFTRRRTSLEFASPELQEWFAEPGNQRMSFPEFRAGLMDDKKAREASQRLRNRGWESEYG